MKLRVMAGNAALTSSQAEKATSERLPETVQIKFQIKRDNEWRDTDTITVSRDDPSHVQRVAEKYVRKNFGIFDSRNRALTPQTCFERVTSNGSHVIYLRPRWIIKTERPRQRPKTDRDTQDCR